MRRSLVVIAALAGFFGLAALFLLGTERGTRWSLGQLAAVAPLEIDTKNTTGTWLSRIGIPLVRYQDDGGEVVAYDIALNINWIRTSLTTIAIDYIGVRRLEIVSPSSPCCLRTAATGESTVANPHSRCSLPTSA